MRKEKFQFRRFDPLISCLKYRIGLSIKNCKRCIRLSSSPFLAFHWAARCNLTPARCTVGGMLYCHATLKVATPDSAQKLRKICNCGILEGAILLDGPGIALWGLLWEYRETVVSKHCNSTDCLTCSRGPNSPLPDESLHTLSSELFAEPKARGGVEWQQSWVC